MPQYELVCVFPGTLTEEEVGAHVGQVKDVLKAESVDEVAQKSMGKMRLAYPIKHIRYGYFELLQFAAEKPQVQAIQEKLRLDTSLLRALVTNFDPKLRAQKEEVLAKYAKNEEESAARRTENVASEQREVKEETKTTEDLVPKSPVKEETKKPVDMAVINEKLDELLDQSLVD